MGDRASHLWYNRGVRDAAAGVCPGGDAWNIFGGCFHAPCYPIAPMSASKPPRAFPLDPASVARLIAREQFAVVRPALSWPEDDWRVARYRASPDGRCLTAILTRTPGGPGGNGHRGECPVACPYGVVGDRLWVREPFALGADVRTVFYKADDPARDAPWYPASSMPRWACRLLLTITGLTLTRRAQASAADAVAEGYATVALLRAAWDDKFAARGYAWDHNPWVWRLTVRPDVVDRNALSRAEEALFGAMTPEDRERFRQIQAIRKQLEGRD